MTSRLAKTPTEPRAFIAWESRRKARYELIDGAVRMMAGGSRAHDVVAGNILAALHLALRATKRSRRSLTSSTSTPPRSASSSQRAPRTAAGGAPFSSASTRGWTWKPSAASSP
jgi:hypothetical protein